jgi:hypothetical protein
VHPSINPCTNQNNRQKLATHHVKEVEPPT